MNCERCSSTRGGLAVALIRSEFLNLKVCGACASEAADLDLQIETLETLPAPLESVRTPAAA